MHRKYSNERLVNQFGTSFLAQQRQALYKRPVAINTSMASSASPASTITGECRGSQYLVCEIESAGRKEGRVSLVWIMGIVQVLHWSTATVTAVGGLGTYLQLLFLL